MRVQSYSSGCLRKRNYQHFYSLIRGNLCPDKALHLVSDRCSFTKGEVCSWVGKSNCSKVQSFARVAARSDADTPRLVT